jgi:hypothetical protein
MPIANYIRTKPGASKYKKAPPGELVSGPKQRRRIQRQKLFQQMVDMKMLQLFWPPAKED